MTSLKLKLWMQMAIRFLTFSLNFSQMVGLSVPWLFMTANSKDTFDLEIKKDGTVFLDGETLS